MLYCWIGSIHKGLSTQYGMKGCYTHCLFSAWKLEPVCLTNDFPGNLLMQKVLLCNAKKMGKRGGVVVVVENVKEVLISHYNNRGWYSLKEKNRQEWMSTAERVVQESQWCYFAFRASRFLSWICLVFTWGGKSYIHTVLCIDFLVQRYMVVVIWI